MSFLRKIPLVAASNVVPSDLTGWGLGPFAAVLQCLHLDTSHLKQQNTEKPYRTKNNYMYVAAGANSGPRIQKRLKPPTATSEEPGANRVLHMPSALNTTEGLGKPPEPPLHSAPDSSLPSPHISNKLTTRSQGVSKQGNLVCSCSLLLQQGPQKGLAWISCLVWPLVNFY